MDIKWNKDIGINIGLHAYEYASIDKMVKTYHDKLLIKRGELIEQLDYEPDNQMQQYIQGRISILNEIIAG